MKGRRLSSEADRGHSGGGGIGGDWYSGGGGIGAGWHSGGGVALWVVLLQDFEGALVLHSFGSGGSTPAHCTHMHTLMHNEQNVKFHGTNTHLRVHNPRLHKGVCVHVCVLCA